MGALPSADDVSSLFSEVVIFGASFGAGVVLRAKGCASRVGLPFDVRCQISVEHFSLYYSIGEAWSEDVPLLDRASG